MAPRWARCTGHQGGRGQGGGEHHGHEVGAQRPELVCVLDRLEREPRDAVHARHTASRSEEERVGRGCEKAKMKSELRPLNFCGASATATVKARRFAPFALRALARSRAPRDPYAPMRSGDHFGSGVARAREVGGSGRFCSSGRGRLDGVVRARELAGQNPRSRGARGRRGVRTRG